MAAHKLRVSIPLQEVMEDVTVDTVKRALMIAGSPHGRPRLGPAQAVAALHGAARQRRDAEVRAARGGNARALTARTYRIDMIVASDLLVKAIAEVL